jgi:glycosyl transferase family 2
VTTARKRPKLSVVTTTHNQEDFAREAFDSFIAQEIDFPMEIIVADDGSTDSTRAIIQEYVDQYPDLFRPILRPKNLGLNRNLVGAMSAARGTYIALCEGDDYWIDPLKLSKQVAFLDQHPEAAVCFHPVRTIWEDGRVEDEDFPPVVWRDDLSLETLIRRNFIQTNSAVYRRLPHYRGIPADVMPLDHYLMVRHAFSGKIAMLPETMSVYRRHSQGMWNNRVVDTRKFWLMFGGGHAAMYDAMIDLAAGDPAREDVIGGMADWIFSEIANVGGPEGRAALVDSIEKHPRCAALALQHRWANDPDRLLAKVESDPDDGPGVLRLAQHYFARGDFSNARKWYGRRVEMGGCDEEVYFATFQIAVSMSNQGEPWPDVEDAYLKAWQLRPTRAEPLYAIAYRCRVDQRYKFAYLFAESAAKIPLPEEDKISVSAEIYAWRASDEQAVCASWIGKHAEAFTLCRGLLARSDIPEPDRQRIAANRDFSVPAMIEAATPYPETVVQSLAPRRRHGRGHRQPDRRAGPARHRTDHQLIPELLPRRIPGRTLPAARHRPTHPRPQTAAEALPVPRIRPIRSQRPTRRPAGKAPRPDRRTVLATPGRRLAILRPRALHHPPHRSTRHRTTGLSGRHQLRRCDQADRHHRRRTDNPPGTRRRPLPAHRGDGHRPSHVRHHPPESGYRRARL